MKKNILVILTGILIFTYHTAFGEVRSWELDKAHSNIYFSVDHIFSKVRGHFNDFKVDVKFDPESLAGSAFNFEIEVQSIDTYIAKRDKHLLSSDFFDERNYPLITFQSDTVSLDSDGKYNVGGKLTIKGVAHSVTLPLTFVGMKEHPAARGKVVAGFNGTLALDRLEYKIGSGKFYDKGVVGKDVEVFVSLELLSKK